MSDRAITETVQLKPLSEKNVATYLHNEQPKFSRNKAKIWEQITAVNESLSTNEILEIKDTRLDRTQQNLVKQLMQHVRSRAEEIGAASSLLANRKSIEKLVRGEPSRVTSGWRLNTIGQELSNIMSPDG